MYTNAAMADKTDMWRFNVPELKDFLRCRGITCSLARKAELVRLCELALEMNLDVITKDDYCDMDSSRRTVIDTDSDSQMTLRSIRNVEEWVDDLSNLPDISNCDILVYLLQYCAWDEKRLKEHKHDNGFKLFNANHISGVELAKISTDFSYIKGFCVPETRQSADPYVTWVLVHKDGWIRSGGCTCVADNGTCKHVVALLFSLTGFCDRHHDRHTQVGTDIKCVWDQQRKTSEPMEITSIDTRLDHSLPIPSEPTPLKYKPTGNSISLNQREIEMKIYDTCKGTDALFLQMVEPPSDDEPDLIHDDLPPTLPEIASSVRNTDFNFVKNIIETHNSAVVDKIEKITQGQRDNPLWFAYRKGRITASLFPSVLHFKFHDDTTNYILRKIIDSCNEQISSAPIQHGIIYEPIARQQYINNEKMRHSKFSVKQCGLFVDNTLPYIGASPDGVVTCKCCGTGLLEIKCTYKYRNNTPIEISSENNYHLHFDNDAKGIRLKKESAWYTQIQGQLGICQLPWCDFVFHTLKEIHIERIIFNDSYFDVIKSKCKAFFTKYVECELLNHC